MSGLYPITTITLNNANLKRQPGARIPLILAQGLATGNFTSGKLVTDIANGIDVATTLCGAGSIGQLMIDGFKKKNTGRLDAIIVSDNGSGVAATGSIVFSGTPTTSGTFNITIGSYLLNRYEIAVTTSSTSTTLGDALVASITADTKSPVTASNSTGTVTITAKNKGTEGNKIGFQIDGAVAGVSIALTAMASGATDPVLTGVLSQIDLARYDIIAPVAFLSTIRTHLEAKFNVTNNILDGLAFVCKTDTYANHQTALAANTLASQVITYFCNKTVNDSDWKGGAIRELDYVIAAKMAALRALRLTDDAILNEFMVGGNTRGGIFTAAIPFHNMKTDFTNIPTGKNFTQLETLGLADLGGSTFSMDSSGTFVTTNPFLLTSYKKTSPTALGLTYHYVNDNDTLTIARDYIFQNLKEIYAQSSLTSGSLPTDSRITVANVRSIKATIVSLWQDLVDANILQGGVEVTTGIDLRSEFQRNLVINVDTVNGSVTGSMVLRRMGQLISFNLDITPKL